MLIVNSAETAAVSCRINAAFSDVTICNDMLIVNIAETAAVSCRINAAFSDVTICNDMLIVNSAETAAVSCRISFLSTWSYQQVVLPLQIFD
jgi:hypothetical protein